MSGFSNYLEEEILKAALNGQSFPLIPTVYLGLHLSSPTDADTGLEVDRPSYTRIQVDFDSPTGGSTSNMYEVNFPIATESWGTITHFGIYSAITSGNLLFWGTFSSPVLIDAGDTLRIPQSSIALSID